MASVVVGSGPLLPLLSSFLLRGGRQFRDPRVNTDQRPTYHLRHSSLQPPSARTTVREPPGQHCQGSVSPLASVPVASAVNQLSWHQDHSYTDSGWQGLSRSSSATRLGSMPPLATFGGALHGQEPGEWVGHGDMHWFSHIACVEGRPP